MYCGVRYQDRWTGGLTIRRIRVLMNHLPPQSNCAALVRGGQPLWLVTDHLLDEIRRALTGDKPHPQRPKPAAPEPLTGKRLKAFLVRVAERRRQIDAGDIT